MTALRAADLPVDSVVATPWKVWISIGMPDPWVASGRVVRDTDEHIDDVLAADGQVLRVGDGSGQL